MSAVLRRFSKREEEEPKSAKLGPHNHKTLILGNKGLKHEHFVLVEDFLGMIPHAKKGSSLPADEFKYLDEIATDKHCDTVAFFETRHRGEYRECYFWLSRVPEGPSFNFFVDDIKGIRQLRSLGNCMKGSRPLLFFDPQFESSEHLSLAKLLLQRFFEVPYQNKHSKPFVDRALSFFVVDGNIIIRHYQIQWTDNENEALNLVEIGPECKLVPTYVLAGAFKGSKIWKNGTFVSRFKVAQAERIQKQKEKRRIRDQQAVREEKKQSIPEIINPMEGLFEEPHDENDDDGFEEDEEIDQDNYDDVEVEEEEEAEA